MGDLELDSRVTGADGAYRASIPESWGIWGPNGGFVAALLLRAAGVHADLPRPASLFVHFLARAEFDHVDIHVRTVRRSRRAESIAATMRQGDRTIAEALVWFVAADLPGLEHDIAPLPDVPRPAELRTAEDLNREAGNEPPPIRFFENLEQRPLDWQQEWPPPGPRPPLARAWHRFRPTATFPDPLVDAGRSVILLDTFGWPAAHVHHAWSWPTGEQPWVAPSIDLHVRFHRADPASEHLYTELRAPVATGGLLTAEGQLWSERGELLASSSSQLLCSPTS